jgi:DNA methylase
MSRTFDSPILAYAPTVEPSADSLTAQESQSASENQHRDYLLQSIAKSRYRQAHVSSAEVGSSWESRSAHSLHSLVPRLGGFPPALARWAVDTYSHPGQLVMDTFAGKGTAPLEALLADRQTIGSDAAPDAYIITCAKLSGITHEDAQSVLNALVVSKDADLTSVPESVRIFFSDNTLAQILSVRRALFSMLDVPPGDVASLSSGYLSKRKKIAIYLLACLMGCLHGPTDWGHARPNKQSPISSNGFYLSVHCNHTYSASPEYVRRYCAEHGLQPPERDIKVSIRRKSELAQADGVPALMGRALCRYAERVRLSSRAHLLVTSPPYFKSQTYAWDNWLRLWLLGYPDYRVVARGLLETASIPTYYGRIRASLHRIRALLAGPGSHAVIVVGDVSTRIKGKLPFVQEDDRWHRYVSVHAGKGRLINTSEIIGDIATNLGFRVELIVNDSIPRGNRALAAFVTASQGTDLDRTVVLRYVG